MNAPIPAPPVPRPLLEWARYWVEQCLLERKARAGGVLCPLCVVRNEPDAQACERCGVPLREDSAPCLACGRHNTEREVEETRGRCARCFEPWTGTAERTPVLVPYAVPGAVTAADVFGDDDPIPF